MRSCHRPALAALLVLLSASGVSAQAVRTVRVVLHQEARESLQHIVRVFARQVAQRCEARVVTDGEAPLTIELAIAPGIGADGFRIEDRPGGGVRILGDDIRGVLYGVGKLLRTSRYDQDGFRAGSWRGTSIPEKPVRGIYFATHFHNFYHDAPIDEVERYVEDVGLWGLNTLIVWYDMHHFNGFESPEAVAFRLRLKAICGAARRIGLDVGLACVANEGYANSPATLRADVKGMRGAAFSTDICTATADGRRYVLDNFTQLYDWAAELEPKWVMIWPYDSGGCGCAQCQPWGYGGYLRCAEPLANLARSKFPGAKVVLSTWFLDGEEWAGLARAFASRPNWVDYLLAEPAFLPGTPNSPPAHPSPAGLPLIGFPEISMIGWPVWGGFGANPLPTRYEREWQELKTQWQGGFPYSEGIFEDINKVLFACFYWKADTTADEALKEYIAFEYSPDVVDLVLPAIHLLEQNAPSETVRSGSVQARRLLEQADARLTAQVRQAWRWRILFLRAQVDAQLYLNRGRMQGRVLHAAFQELTGIYHAQGAEPAVKPPQVDLTESVELEPTVVPRNDHGNLPPGWGMPEDPPRAVSRASVEYLQALRKNEPFGTHSFDLASLRAGMGSRRAPTVEGVQLLPAKIDDIIPCEWVLAPSADPDLRLLYLHGGGFVSGSGGFYLALAAHLSAAAKCAVLLPDYRLAPEHPFPAGLEDCVRAHNWLIANGPTGPAPCKATWIAGDSAGGNLTLATLLALRDRGRPLPSGVIALSPATDLTLASESLRTVDDPIISAQTMPVFREHYLGTTNPRNPLASPVFGDYRGLPPLLVQVGEHEMLRDDGVRVAEKARADGMPVKLEIWPGMFHVFQSHEPLLPEGREAIDHAADFMRSSMSKQ